jgi:hypothetical protein
MFTFVPFSQSDTIFLSHSLQKTVKDRFEAEFERATMKILEARKVQGSSSPSSALVSTNGQTTQVAFEEWFGESTHVDLCKRVMLELETDTLHYHAAFPK